MTKSTPITDNFVEFKEYRTYFKKKIEECSTTIEEIMGFVEYKKDPLFEDEDEFDDYVHSCICSFGIHTHDKSIMEDVTNLLQEFIDVHSVNPVDL